MKTNLREKKVVEGSEALLAVGPFREIYAVARLLLYIHPDYVVPFWNKVGSAYN